MSITVMQNHTDKAIQEPQTKDSVFKYDFSFLEVGDVVDCETKVGTFHGEVLTFDQETKLLVLRDTTEQRPQMRLINMAHIDLVRRISTRSPTFSFNPPKDSHETAQQRLKYAESKKKELWVDNVSKDGIELFNDLRKLYNDVTWVDKVNIRVLKCVVIKEPYDENCIECTDKQPSSTLTSERITSRKSTKPTANGD